MTNYIEIIYLLTSPLAVYAMIPQVNKLIATKRSDELNLSSWIMWDCSQIISLCYAISLNAVGYIIVNIAWIVFYSVMAVLIIKYRKDQYFKRVLFHFFRTSRKAGLSVVRGVKRTRITATLAKLYGF